MKKARNIKSPYLKISPLHILIISQEFLNYLLFKNVSNSWEDLQGLIITRSTTNKVSFYEEVI